MSTMIKNRRAQTAIEYLLLLMSVAAITLVGFRTYLNRVNETANLYYNRAVPGIVGPPNRCGDGVCRPEPFENCAKCPVDCGVC